MALGNNFAVVLAANAALGVLVLPFFLRVTQALPPAGFLLFVSGAVGVWLCGRKTPYGARNEIAATAPDKRIVAVMAGSRGPAIRVRGCYLNPAR